MNIRCVVPLVTLGVSQGSPPSQDARVVALYPESVRHLDPCSRLCGEFSPERRGNGATLCEYDVSRCIESYGAVSAVCTYLYWSETESGETGLVYSFDGQDLFPDEISRIVTCEEAVEILQPRPYTDS